MSTENDNNNTEAETATSGTLMRRDRPLEKTDRERRDTYVGRWRFVLKLTEAQIVARLAKLDPPIIVSRTTISRDVQRLRSTFRQHFTRGGFDPRAEVAILVGSMEHIIGRSFRDARRSTDSKERALHWKVALDAIEKLFAVYEATGLVDRRDFLLPVDADGEQADRIPSGEELQALFESVTVNPEDLVSKAQRSWEYGDYVESKRASLEATDGGHGRNGNGNGNGQGNGT